ncbi:MAG: CotH kinase family protein, partial [Verrucomicrobiota bacterium]
GIEQGGVTANYFQDWERPVHVEFYGDGPNRDLVFSQEAGIKMNGRFSRILPQKPILIRARSRYGSSDIAAQIFEDKPLASFDRLLLRNSGNQDWTSTMLRDGLAQTLPLGQMDIDYQAYRPCVLLLNGTFWGIHNIREKVDTAYFENNFGVEPENLNLFENQTREYGPWSFYLNLLNFVQNQDLNVPGHYDHVRSEMDLDQYINYQILEIFVGNWDWPLWNIAHWRDYSVSSKWRWVLVDLDASFGLVQDTTYDFVDHATATNGPNFPNPPHTTVFFRSLLTSDAFRDEFIQRFAAYLNASFHPERVTNVIDTMQAHIAPDMPGHIGKWGGRNSGTGWGSVFTSMAEWQTNVAVMTEFAEQHPARLRQGIIDEFELGGTATLTIDLPASGAGHVLANGVPVTREENIFFTDVPLRLEASPGIGHRFLHWTGPVSSNSNTVSLVLTNNTSIEAVFEPTGDTILPSEIATNTTLTQAGSPYLAPGDIIVHSNTTLAVEAGVQILMPDKASIYVYGQLFMTGSEAEPIEIKSNPYPSARRPLYPAGQPDEPPRWGTLIFHHATGRSELDHVRIRGASSGRDRVNHKGAVSSFHSEIALTSVDIREVDFPVFVQYGRATFTNCSIHTEVVSDLINVKYADYASVDGCDLRGNSAVDTDALDYDQISDGVIRRNRIYDFMGPNSDGIDLGEGSRGILIQSNLIYNCTDKGISIGQASTAIVEYNVILNCSQGVGIKDQGSYAHIDRNTFHGNGVGIACFEKNLGDGGGCAEVIHTILSGSETNAYEVDSKSWISIDYSLSDTDTLPGTGNLFSNPLFAAGPSNFTLQGSSPCIDAGNTNAPPDPNGTVADMGAIPYERPEPVIRITAPLNPAEYLHHESIRFAGSGVDLESNAVTDLTWHSSLTGDFGTGMSLTAGPFPPGLQTITLTGVDATGAVGMDSIDIDVFLDSTTNGLPDWWEDQFWPGGNSGGGTNDSDRDGQSNQREWIAGSDPTNPASFFRIGESWLEPGGNHLVLQWPSIPSRRYVIEHSTNHMQSFAPLVTNLMSTPPLNTYTTTQDRTNTLFRLKVTR